MLRAQIIHMLLINERIIEPIDEAGLGHTQPITGGAVAAHRPQALVSRALYQQPSPTRPGMAQNLVPAKPLDFVPGAFQVEIFREKMPASDHAQLGNVGMGLGQGSCPSRGKDAIIIKLAQQIRPGTAPYFIDCSDLASVLFREHNLLNTWVARL